MTGLAQTALKAFDLSWSGREEHKRSKSGMIDVESVGDIDIDRRGENGKGGSVEYEYTGYNPTWH